MTEKTTTQKHAEEATVVNTAKVTEPSVAKPNEEQLKEKIKVKTSAKSNVKKDFAAARAPNLPMSKRQGMYLCAFIKGKTIEQAVRDLEQVILLKKAVPFKGEIPHRHGKGMMSGRYPVRASKLLIPILKTLRGNILVNGLNLEQTQITLASATWDSRPMRKGGTHAKRTYLILEAREVVSK